MRNLPERIMFERLQYRPGLSAICHFPSTVEQTAAELKASQTEILAQDNEEEIWIIRPNANTYRSSPLLAYDARRAVFQHGRDFAVVLPSLWLRSMECQNPNHMPTQDEITRLARGFGLDDDHSGTTSDGYRYWYVPQGRRMRDNTESIVGGAMFFSSMMGSHCLPHIVTIPPKQPIR